MYIYSLRIAEILSDVAVKLTWGCVTVLHNLSPVRILALHLSVAGQSLSCGSRWTPGEHHP